MEGGDEVGHKGDVLVVPGLRAVDDAVHADEIEEADVGHHGVHTGEHSTGEAWRRPHFQRNA